MQLSVVKSWFAGALESPHIIPNIFVKLKEKNNSKREQKKNRLQRKKKQPTEDSIFYFIIFLFLANFSASIPADLKLSRCSNPLCVNPKSPQVLL